VPDVATESPRESAVTLRPVLEAGAGSRTLTAVDRMMLAAHQSLRRLGYPGFINLMIVELGGRIDAADLRRGIARLCRAHPVLCSRLVADGAGRPARWQFRPGASCELHETELAGSDREALLGHAEEILAVPAVLDREDPVVFHHCRRPDGRDALIIRYEHAVMDTSPLDKFLTDLDEYTAGREPPEPGPEPDDIRDHLMQFPFLQRARAVTRTRVGPPPWKLGLPVTIAAQRDVLPGPRAYRIAVREIPSATMSQVAARVTRACGYPSLSMGLLASIFRALVQHSPRNPDRYDRLVTHIGFNLRRPGAPLAVRNIAAVMPIGAGIEEAGDRDELVRTLARRLRERLQRGTDLGLLQLMYYHSRWMWLVRRQTRSLFMKRQSLNYGCFSSSLPVGATFAGAPIEAAYHAASASSPPGLSLLATQFQRRLIIAAAYVPDAIAPSRAGAFLDTLVSDLTA